MRISDWSSDVCSSDLRAATRPVSAQPIRALVESVQKAAHSGSYRPPCRRPRRPPISSALRPTWPRRAPFQPHTPRFPLNRRPERRRLRGRPPKPRSEEHTSELQSLMRISYAVFCLKKKKTKHTEHTQHRKQYFNNKSTKN